VNSRRRGGGGGGKEGARYQLPGELRRSERHGLEPPRDWDGLGRDESGG